MLRPVVRPVDGPVLDPGPAHITVLVIPPALHQLEDARVERLAPVRSPQVPTVLVQRRDAAEAGVRVKGLLDEPAPAKRLPLRRINPIPDVRPLHHGRSDRQDSSILQVGGGWAPPTPSYKRMVGGAHPTWTFTWSSPLGVSAALSRPSPAKSDAAARMNNTRLHSTPPVDADANRKQAV